MHKHHYHSPKRRAFYSFMLLLGVVTLGTLGIHFLEDFSYMDSFFFTSMIATGQGPVGDLSPQTTAGKLFTSFLAFVSVGALLAALGFLFGPFLWKLWKVGIMKFEEEIHLIEKHSKEKKTDSH